jgi:hypothetical protein
MMTFSDLELAATNADSAGASRIVESGARRTLRSFDCAAMARMPLATLLYYVLVGDVLIADRQS